MCQAVSLHNLYAQQSWEVSYGPTGLIREPGLERSGHSPGVQPPIPVLPTLDSTAPLASPESPLYLLLMGFSCSQGWLSFRGSADKVSTLGQKRGLWISVSGSSQAYLGCSSNRGLNRCLRQSSINQLPGLGSCPQGDSAGHSAGGSATKRR